VRRILQCVRLAYDHSARTNTDPRENKQAQQQQQQLLCDFPPLWTSMYSLFLYMHAQNSTEIFNVFLFLEQNVSLSKLVVDKLRVMPIYCRSLRLLDF
jgi:hypothetical protein